jgi:hypothetical protein
MWSIGNLKSTQLRKLFQIFKSNLMKSLNNFGPWEGTRFEFTCFSWFWILENLSTGSSPQAAAQSRLRPGQPLPGPAPTHHRVGNQAVTKLMTERVPVPIVDDPHGRDPLSMRQHPVGGSFAPILPPRSRLRLCSALHHPLLPSLLTTTAMPSHGRPRSQSLYLDVLFGWCRTWAQVDDHTAGKSSAPRRLFLREPDTIDRCLWYTFSQTNSLRRTAKVYCPSSTRSPLPATNCQRHRRPSSSTQLHCHREPGPVSPFPSNPSNRVSLSPGKVMGNTFPGSSPLTCQN